MQQRQSLCRCDLTKRTASPLDDAVQSQTMLSLPKLVVLALFAGFNTGGYTKSFVLKGTNVWRRLPASMAWPGGETGFPACEGIYIRKALQCGNSGQYCSSNYCCGNTRCCLEDTTCCGTQCCSASQQCCDGSYCAASCVSVNPEQGTSPTTPTDWVYEAQRTGVHNCQI